MIVKSVKGNLYAKICVHKRQLTELDNLVFVLMVTSLPWKQRKG